jgi:GAF domain-containing protein
VKRAAETPGKQKPTIAALSLALQESEAHAQATRDILAAISRSPGDAQPVFDEILRHGSRLAAADFGAVFQVDADGRLRGVAATTIIPEMERHLRTTGIAVGQPTPVGIAARDRQTVRVVDAQSDPRFALPEVIRREGMRSVLSVPLVSRRGLLGVLTFHTREVRPFTDRQAALIETFAEQAVIAIEHVRLFTQTKDALDEQTATADILRVISRSPTDVQPIFDAIVQSTVRLCKALMSSVYRFDGERLHFVAHHGYTPEALAVFQRTYPLTPDQDRLLGEALRTGTVVNVADIVSEYRAPIGQQELGHRSVLAVPMLRDGKAIGVIATARREPGLFPESQVALLRTFADQAVIAIENVRLFTEIQQKNGALTAALDQQTATGEILRVIASSPTDDQPVFDAIVTSAVRLCRAHSGTLTRVVGEQVHLMALTSTEPAADAALRAFFPRPLDFEGGHADAIRRRVALNIADLPNDESSPETMRAVARARDYRSLAVVPLVRHGDAIGAISVTRRETGGFTPDEMALLHTFADQALIAIENVRVFRELQERNRAVTEALDRQTATAEILRVISASTNDVEPVFGAIAENSLRLLQGWSVIVWQREGDGLRPAAMRGGHEGSEQRVRELFPAHERLHTFAHDAVADREPRQVPDSEAEGVHPRVRDAARARGWRANLAVPMVQGRDVLGVITLSRVEPGAFTPQEVDLLKTFADQAVIAIQNTRLLTELKDRTAQLTRSVEQLTALGEVGRAVSSTLDLETVLTTIVSRAVQLAGVDGGVVFEYDDASQEFVHRAAREQGGPLAAVRRAARIRRGEGIVGRTALTLEPAQIADITAPGAYESRLRDNLIASGIRGLLAVPMVNADGNVLGSLVVSRNTPGEFSAETVDLLRTFATQSTLAIQNARLFEEIAEKSRQLEAANRHKDEFLANMSHELRTPLNGIIGFSEVILERMFGEINAKQEEYLNDILSSGRHLLSLINDILDLSKIEAGKMELELADFHAPAAIDNAMMLMRERAARRGQSLERAVDPDLGEIRADERKFKQVLLNLLSNAVKFTPEGGRITVGARVENGEALVWVTDTGIGIAPEHHELVFEEFRQVGRADKKAEGTGLGLALCRKFIELHGGRISLASELGKGSTFMFAVPLARPR